MSAILASRTWRVRRIIRKSTLFPISEIAMRSALHASLRALEFDAATRRHRTLGSRHVLDTHRLLLGRGVSYFKGVGVNDLRATRASGGTGDVKDWSDHDRNCHARGVGLTQAVSRKGRDQCSTYF